MSTATLSNPENLTQPLMVTRQDAARLLGLSLREVDNLRASGRLMAKKHGSKVLFPRAELERFVNDLPWEIDQ
ncbi:excise [Mycobacterium phage DuncansLeg]|nr:excise [Mycobacterium phage DuncansLeg]